MQGLNLENDFQKYGQPTLSPEGHNYQLSYAAEAAKNSPGRIYFKGEEKWYLFTPGDKKITEDDYFFNNSSSLFFFLGHKIYNNNIQNFLQENLNKRNIMLSSSKNLCNGKESLIDSGLFAYVKKRILEHNNLFYTRYGRPVGVTIVSLVKDPYYKSPQIVVVYPNNKVEEQMTSFYEGDFTEEEYLEVKNLLSKQEISDSFLKSKKKDLKKYNVYSLNFETQKIEEVF